MNNYTQSKRKILVFTNAYPNNIDINLGLDIKRQIGGISADFDIKVISPIAYYPFKDIIFRQNGKVVDNRWESGIETFYPRYLVIPKILRWLYGFFYFIAVRDLVTKINKSFKFDLIISYWAYPDGFAAVLLAKKYQVPAVIRPRGSDINILPRGWLTREFIRYALKRAREIWPVCHDLKNKIVGLGIKADKIKVISLGVDIKRFVVADSEKSREKLGVNSGLPMLLFVGDLRRIKGIDNLIKAVNILQSEKRQRVRLNIIGSGPLKRHFEKLVIKYNLEESVKFRGEVANTELPIWLNAVDLFCLPSKSEGWPNVIMEALACGVPIVATKVGGVPEIINDAKYGILVEPNHPEKLAEAIEQALTIKWDRKVLTERIRDFTWTDIITQLSSQIAGILDN